MKLTPDVPAVEVIMLGEPPWCAVHSTDRVTTPVVAEVTMHVAQARMARPKEGPAPTQAWLQGVADSWLYDAAQQRRIVWDEVNELWVRAEPSFAKWCASVWNRFCGGE